MIKLNISTKPVFPTEEEIAWDNIDYEEIPNIISIIEVGFENDDNSVYSVLKKWQMYAFGQWPDIEVLANWDKSHKLLEIISQERPRSSYAFMLNQKHETEKDYEAAEYFSSKILTCLFKDNKTKFTLTRDVIRDEHSKYILDSSKLHPSPVYTGFDLAKPGTKSREIK